MSENIGEKDLTIDEVEKVYNERDMYRGLWKDAYDRAEKYEAQVKELTEQVDDLKAQVKDLLEDRTELLKANARRAGEVDGMMSVLSFVFSDSEVQA